MGRFLSRFNGLTCLRSWKCPPYMADLEKLLNRLHFPQPALPKSQFRLCQKGLGITNFLVADSLMRGVGEKIDESAWEIVVDDSAECQIIANLHSNSISHGIPEQNRTLCTQGVILDVGGLERKVGVFCWEHHGELWERAARGQRFTAGGRRSLQ